MGSQESKLENSDRRVPREGSSKIWRKKHSGSSRSVNTQESASSQQPDPSRSRIPNAAVPEAKIASICAPTAAPISAAVAVATAPVVAAKSDCGICVIDYGGASAEGSSGHENEDRWLVLDHAPGAAAFHLFIVIDGHGGELAADYVKADLPNRLNALYANGGFSDDKQLQNAFDQLDTEFCEEATKKKNTSGACVTVVILYKNAASQPELLVLNVGDCRVIVSEQEGDSAVAITTDHTASQMSEKRRIEENGGYVMHGRVIGVMEPSRSVGDIDMKAEAMEGAVVATPEVFRRPVKIGQTTIVLATDGVWSVLENDEVMAIAKREINKKDADQNDDGSAQAAAHAIIEESINKDSNDDITAIVLTV